MKVMEKQQKTISNQALNFGIVTGLVMIVFTVILYLFNATAEPYAGYGNYIILLIGIILATKIYRDKEAGGYLRYGQGVGLGTLLALFASILAGIFSYLLYAYIDPSAIEPMLDAARDQMYQRGLEGRELDQAMSMTEKFTSPHWIAISSIFYTTIVGLILSLIVTIFLKREQPEK